MTDQEDYTPAFGGSSGYYKPDDYYDDNATDVNGYQPGFSQAQAKPQESHVRQPTMPSWYDPELSGSRLSPDTVRTQYNPETASRGRNSGKPELYDPETSESYQPQSPQGLQPLFDRPTQTPVFRPVQQPGGGGPTYNPGGQYPQPSQNNRAVSLIYQMFVDYLGNVTMSLHKYERGWATYACKFVTGMMLESRYLFVFVRTDNPSEQVQLGELNWANIQFRTMAIELDVVENRGRSDREFRRFLGHEMTAERAVQKGFPYIGSVPIRCTILRGEGRPSSYPERLELYKIIETWNCSVDIL